MIRDFAKHGNLSPESIDKIGWLMDGGLHDIQWLIGLMRVTNHLPEKSTESRDQYREIADTARKLSALIETDPTHALNYVREIKQIADEYDSAADDADPKGKPQPRNAAHYALAYYLVRLAVFDGKLSIEPRINNDSDFAKLYRVCCKEAGLSVQKNVTSYLRDAIQKANHELQEQQRSIEETQQFLEKYGQTIIDAFTRPIDDK